jgi:periplasmic divalent cation tolerance protein
VSAGEYLVVLITAPDRDLAERLADALVGESLAACVNVIEGCRSVYRWKGEIVRDDEALMIVKTSRERFDALEKRVRELHSYEVPEIVGLDVARVSGGYEQFLRDVLGGRAPGADKKPGR